jgi:hypothetical protein
MYKRPRTQMEETPEVKFPLFSRIALAALVAVVLSGSLFFSYYLISQIQRSQQPTGSAPGNTGQTAPNGSTSAWALRDVALLNAAGTGKETVHVAQNFPLTLLGPTSNVNGVQWYQVEWKTPKSSGQGWAPATALTFTSPGNVPGWASFDVLSPALEEYMSDQGQNTSAVAYDVTRGRYYTYNMNGRFITGSSIKVSVMLTFLDKLESEGREPNTTENCLLQHMIEESDNDATSAFYYGFPYEEVCPGSFETAGGAAGIAKFLSKVGVTGLYPFPTAFGYSTITPLAMVHLLTLLHEGKLLTQQDRTLALGYMENIDPAQQIGVGYTAPDDAVVAMKDGWLQGPGNDLWAVNSSGIVTLDDETYIISVYSDEQDAIDDGCSIANHVCSAVASALLPDAQPANKPDACF